MQQNINYGNYHYMLQNITIQNTLHILVTLLSYPLININHLRFKKKKL